MDGEVQGFSLPFPLCGRSKSGQAQGTAEAAASANEDPLLSQSSLERARTHAWRQGRASPGISRILLWVSSGGEDANAAGEAEKPDLMSAEPGHPAVAAASRSLRLSHTLPCLRGWQQRGGRAAQFLDPGAGRWQGKGGPFRPSATALGDKAVGRDPSSSHRHRLQSHQRLPLDHHRTQSQPPEVPGSQRSLVLGYFIYFSLFFPLNLPSHCSRPC